MSSTLSAQSQRFSLAEMCHLLCGVGIENEGPEGRLGVCVGAPGNQKGVGGGIGGGSGKSWGKTF